MRHTITAGIWFLVLAPQLAAEEPHALYESRIRPLLIEQCYSCHSETTKKVKGDLKLDTPTAWLKGGSSGPAVVPGRPNDSPLIQAIRRNHKDISAMPPEKPLTREQISLLEDWVKRGAPAPAGPPPKKPTEPISTAQQRWPFTLIPERIPVPKVQDTAWPLTNIDRFILAKLEAQHLRPVGEAEKRVFFRRVTFDLIGLPPSVEESDAFAKDASPEAYEKLVDRLLASPRYGERWGRHWLDVVRYADTAGDNSDFPIPQMVQYRDWVIDALNRDQPYNEFVRDQITGDLVPGGTERERQQRTIATGYLASARRFGSTVPDYPWHLTIEDTLDNLGRAFLGLSLNCARCHDHKFDPISMKDYYALYGIFQSSRYPWPGIELEQRQRDLVVFASADKVQAELTRREKANQKYAQELKLLDTQKRETPDKTRQAELQKQIDALRDAQRQDTGTPLPFPTAYAMAEGQKIGDAALQLKGDPGKPGAVVRRRFLEVLGGMALPESDKSSGRLALAGWITSPQNPLFARVMVNRVWHHHFGRGLVATPNDFGKQGADPTHPELLDHLARQFVEDGFSLKKLHKRILLSRVYRMASQGEVPGANTIDPNNELLHRFRLRRLDAESLRDSLLFVSGNLDLTRPGPHPFPPQQAWNFTQHKPFRAVYDHRHRSVYLIVQRIQRHPFLANFDGADTGASNANRVTSTTALQSLYFLNDSFVHEMAKDLAAKLQRDLGSDPERIRQAYRVLFARSPQPNEVKTGLAYLKKAEETATENPMASYLRALIRLNEFIYLD
jgi:hypothetical protein